MPKKTKLTRKMPEFLPLSEVVKLAQKEGADINVRKVRYWVKKGQFPQPVYIKKGKTRVSAYPPEVIEAMVSLSQSEQKALETGVSKFAKPYLIKTPRFWDLQRSDLSEVNFGATLAKRNERVHIFATELPQVEKMDFADYAISGLVFEVNSLRQRMKIDKGKSNFIDFSVKLFGSQKQIPKGIEPIIKGMVEIKKMRSKRKKPELIYPIMVIKIIEKLGSEKNKKRKRKT